MKITLETTISRNDQSLMGGEMGDETVLMNLNTGDYLGLNSVGSSIWRIIQQPITIADICTQLQNEYQIDTATCQSETIKYINILLAENMIKIQ